MKHHLTFACIAVAAIAIPSIAQERRNYFDDPFVSVTAALPGCPVAEPPLITEAQMRAETHYRAERGNSCYLSGRCRLQNAYFYDKEIVPRVARFLQRDGRFDDTTVWVMGQRRWVYLKGCVNSLQQSLDMERAARNVDDVESVINELMVGTDGVPRYAVVRAAAP